MSEWLIFYFSFFRALQSCWKSVIPICRTFQGEKDLPLRGCHCKLDHQYRGSNINERDYLVGQSTRTAFAILVMFFKIHVGKNVFYIKTLIFSGALVLRTGSRIGFSTQGRHRCTIQQNHSYLCHLFGYLCIYYLCICDNCLCNDCYHEYWQFQLLGSFKNGKFVELPDPKPKTKHSIWGDFHNSLTRSNNIHIICHNRKKKSYFLDNLLVVVIWRRSV